MKYDPKTLNRKQFIGENKFLLKPGFPFLIPWLKLSHVILALRYFAVLGSLH